MKKYTELQIKNNCFEGLKYYQPTCYHDFRGYYWTVYNNKQDNEVYNHDKITVSRKNTLRGIHGDAVTTKLITCVYGEVYCVVVDNRKDSYTYLKWDHIILSDKNKKMVLLPPGFGNSFCVLSEYSIFMYKWSYKGKYPDVNKQFSLKWNDRKIGINWPISNPILSDRDKNIKELL